MRILFALAALLVLGGCDRITGAAYPNLEGRYDAEWRLRLTHAATGDSAQIDCPASLTVTRQSRGSFSGNFSIQSSPDCEASSGSIDGGIRTDGALSFRFGLSGADSGGIESITGCEFVSGSEQLTGTFGGGRINASTSLVLDCPTDLGTQRFDVVLSFFAARLV